ncbi:MAG TPA: transcriptional activator NhaR [Planctomycetota bacterium]|nr:transcriptional activator NhaR [Planctomycetota bacterium]
MEWINYHHLLYFFTVAREGSLARASAELGLAPSTISGQIRSLEQSIGEKLFTKSGRRLAPTEMGRLVFRYAEEIFSIGRELQDAIKGRPAGRPLTLNVGIADVVPKLVARRLLEPALKLQTPVRLVCREDRPERLLGELATHDLDVVLADAPVGPSSRVRAFSHLLGECSVVFFASERVAAKYRRNFPDSLDDAPLLLPTENTSLRRSIDHWLAARGIRPRIVAEFEDSALLKVFGQTGTGLFPAPSVIARQVRAQYQARSVGEVPEIRERFYAISVERRLEHPAVIAISEEARHKLFG